MLISQVKKSCWYALVPEIIRAHYFVAFFTKIHFLSLSIRIHQTNLNCEDILQNTWPLLFLKSVKVTKDKKVLKNSQSRESKRDMTAKCNVDTWTGSWDRMRTSAKTHEMQTVYSSVNNIVHKHHMGCKMVTVGKQGKRCAGTSMLALQFFCESKITSNKKFFEDWKQQLFNNFEIIHKWLKKRKYKN